MLLIRKNIIPLVIQNIFLHLPPVTGIQQLSVPFQKPLPKLRVIHHKMLKLLGEKIALSDVKPRLIGHLLFGAARFRHRADADFIHPANLVVIIKHHAVLPRNAEVF